MSDGALDLTVFLLCLAILIPFGVNAIVPLSKNIAIEAQEVVEDKSISSVEGYMIDEGYDGTLDIFEVILTTQVQDASMPYPRLLTIPNKNCPSEKYHYYTNAEVTVLRRSDPSIPSNAGCLISTGSLNSGGNIFSCVDTAVIGIDSMYKPDVMSYGALVYKGLNGSYNFNKYVIEYNYGRQGNQSNASYNENAKESYRIRKVS